MYNLFIKKLSFKFDSNFSVQKNVFCVRQYDTLSYVLKMF